MWRQAKVIWWMGVVLLSITACGKADQVNDNSSDRSIGPDPTPAACPGVCVHTAPATYTGPSLFWIGQLGFQRECPPDTPYQGIQGIVTSPPTGAFARECRVTPTDGCDTEGLTCVPLPTEDFHVCIHHDESVACPDEYPEEKTMIDDESEIPVTLCCSPAMVPA